MSDKRRARNDAPAGNSSRQGGIKPTSGLSNRPPTPAMKGTGPGPHRVHGHARQHPKVLMPITRW
jgi:hypothetical protein